VRRGWRNALRSLPRNMWTLERFGLIPTKLRYRLADPGAPRVLLVSLPKAGTHLLERAVCLHPRLYRKLLPTIALARLRRWKGLDGLLARIRPGQVVVSHLAFDPSYPALLAARNVRAILVIRDPHDMVVSQVHYVTKRTEHRLHGVFAEREHIKDRLKLAIGGDPDNGVPSVGDRLDRFAGWLGTDCLVVRFEDLVGPQGGGDPDSQARAVASVYRHLGMDVDQGFIGSICERLFSSVSPTFHKGTSGGWRDLFDPELEALFDRVVGDKIVPYGYRLSEDR
jgi:hypothetical protein